MEKLLTVEEVAKYLRVSERTLFRYIKTKKLRAYRIGQWRVSESALKDFLNKHTNV